MHNCWFESLQEVVVLCISLKSMASHCPRLIKNNEEVKGHNMQPNFLQIQCVPAQNVLVYKSSIEINDTELIMAIQI